MGETAFFETERCVQAFQGGTTFVDHLCYVCLVFVMLSCLFIAALFTCWERAEILAFVCDV